jgi:hypothetical protein
MFIAKSMGNSISSLSRSSMGAGFFVQKTKPSMSSGRRLILVAAFVLGLRASAHPALIRPKNQSL